MTVIHNLNGTGDYHYEGEGTVLDYDYSSSYGNTESSYEVSWETLGDGITVSEGGGCPEGSIRYDFPPYHSLVVFNGAGTATSTDGTTASTSR